MRDNLQIAFSRYGTHLSNLQTNLAINRLYALWIVPSAIAVDADVSAVLFLSLEVRFVICSPFLLIILEVRHENAGQFNDERDYHEDQTEHEREAELMGGVLERRARDIVYP